jgi:hypothetical protein
MRGNARFNLNKMVTFDLNSREYNINESRIICTLFRRPVISGNGI